MKQNSGISIIMEKYEEGLSSIKSKKSNILKEDQLQTSIEMKKLSDSIQKNNTSTTKENIINILKSSKKERKQSATQKPPDLDKSFLSSDNSMNPLPYTKNFKKKKIEEINHNFPLKKIKVLNDDSNLPQIISQKQSFKSKRKFIINKKDNDFMQLSQSLKDPDQLLLFNDKNEFQNINKENETNNKNITNPNVSPILEGDLDPFRQTFRKKEDRQKLTGFSCDQCEKVCFFSNKIKLHLNFYMKFYKALGRGLSLDISKLCKCTSRHKDLYEITNTPEVI